MANQKTGANVQVAAGTQKADAIDIDFDKIQGNIFGGFNKDHQVNILIEITDIAKAKSVLNPPGVDNSVANHMSHSTSQDVLAFNEQFRALRRANLPEGSILATWTNMVFTARGMQKVVPKKDQADLKLLPTAFTGGTDKNGDFQGMLGRATSIGDTDVTDATGKLVSSNGPDHWNNGMDVKIPWANVDLMILVASDDPNQLDRCNLNGRLAAYLSRIETAGSGLTVLGIIRGETRVDAGADQVGHEHFGFKDGVSQPGIRGVDAPDDPLHNPDQGNPGQDLLHPGEFVLGYPTQIPTAEALPGGGFFDGPNRIPGPNSLPNNLPPWLKNGSFLVFRRLAQDVKGFREAVAAAAGSIGLSTDLMGAKLVGRYRSGAPLEALKFQAGNGEYQTPLVDPGITNPALANSNALNNSFEYGDDPDGDIVPVAAHIRKAYPRDQVPAGQAHARDAESFTQTHRLLRRGIPFGHSLGAPEGGGPDDPRGLLFFAYQSDIERQFEFVQSSWVNDANFPKPGAGQDPIITNNSVAGPISGCPFHRGADKSKCPVTFTHFVKTRGGGYFFSPSIDTLKAWGLV